MTRFLLSSLLCAAACSSPPLDFPVQVGNANEASSAAGAVLVEWKPGAEAPESVADRAVAQAGRKVWTMVRAPKAATVPHEILRFVSYDSVLGGVTGIWYATDLSTAAVGIVAEMRSMTPIIVRGRPIPLPFAAPVNGLRARAWTYRGRDYLILLNRAKDRQWKVPEEALERTWRPLFDARRDPRELLKNFQDSYYLKPYQVLVLESRLKPKRLLW